MVVAVFNFPLRARARRPIYDRTAGDVAADGGRFHPDSPVLVEVLAVDRADIQLTLGRDKIPLRGPAERQASFAR